jgi:hypothetical protein
MNSSPAVKARNVFFVLLGIAGDLLKRHYSGPGWQVIHDNGGNLAVSFAVYFVATNLPLYHRSKRLVTAGLALAVVELFEVLDGFGVMTNVYDPFDLLANLGGVVLALTLDILLDHRRRASAIASPMQPEKK